MHDWSSDALWNKAKIYIERAFTGDRDNELFPFFAAIGLEFLARAALARVHPSLLADPQDGNNILSRKSASSATAIPSGKPMPTKPPVTTVSPSRISRTASSGNNFTAVAGPEGS